MIEVLKAIDAAMVAAEEVLKDVQPADAMSLVSKEWNKREWLGKVADRLHELQTEYYRDVR